MNKQELVEAIQARAVTYKESGIQKNTVEAVLNALADAVQDAMHAGNEVSLPGIGKFTVEERAARKGRNPKTGEEIDIAAKHVAKFSPAKALKDTLAK